VLKPQQESYSPPNVSARDGFFSSLLELNGTQPGL
jgi:hypothetical protein